jgi:hypothetical protein
VGGAGGDGGGRRDHASATLIQVSGATALAPADRALACGLNTPTTEAAVRPGYKPLLGHPVQPGPMWAENGLGD